MLNRGYPGRMSPHAEGSHVYRLWTWRDSPVHLRDILAGGTSGRFGCSGLSVSAFPVLPAGKDCSCSRFLSWRVAEGLADSAVRFFVYVQRIHSLDDRAAVRFPDRKGLPRRGIRIRHSLLFGVRRRRLSCSLEHSACAGGSAGGSRMTRRSLAWLRWL